jgi:hypothetical protein
MSRPIPHRTVQDINRPGNPAEPNKLDTSKKINRARQLTSKKKVIQLLTRDLANQILKK